MFFGRASPNSFYRLASPPQPSESLFTLSHLVCKFDCDQWNNHLANGFNFLNQIFNKKQKRLRNWNSEMVIFESVSGRVRGRSEKAQKAMFWCTSWVQPANCSLLECKCLACDSLESKWRYILIYVIVCTYVISDSLWHVEAWAYWSRLTTS